MTTAEPVVDSQQTTCCVVGGGPGGMMLALLLARLRVPVTLLEQHKDFDRDFRGDTIPPSTLELLEQIGLAEPLHRLQHAKIYGPTLRLANGTFSPIDFRRLKTRFPYILLVPQARFLDFLAVEASKYPDFRLVMGANVEQLIEEEGQVRGSALSGRRRHARSARLAHGRRRRALLASSPPGRLRRGRDLGTDGHPLVPLAAHPRRSAGGRGASSRRDRRRPHPGGLRSFRLLAGRVCLSKGAVSEPPRCRARIVPAGNPRD